MASTKRNITLVVEEDILLAARKLAADRGTSVSRLVRVFLANLVENAGREYIACARLKGMFETGLVRVGDRTWIRDDLYER